MLKVTLFHFTFPNSKKTTTEIQANNVQHPKSEIFLNNRPRAFDKENNNRVKVEKKHKNDTRRGKIQSERRRCVYSEDSVQQKCERQ